MLVSEVPLLSLLAKPGPGESRRCARHDLLRGPGSRRPAPGFLSMSHALLAFSDNFQDLWRRQGFAVFLSRVFGLSLSNPPFLSSLGGDSKYHALAPDCSLRASTRRSTREPAKYLQRFERRADSKQMHRRRGRRRWQSACPQDATGAPSAPAALT